MGAKTAIVFLADGFEEVEALSVVDYLRRGKVEVTTVKVPSADTTSNKSDRTAISSHKVPVIADETLDECVAKINKGDRSRALPDCVYAPGGMPGSVHLSESKQVLSVIRQCFDAGKLVSAICAAPALVLSRAGVLAGKKWTCYPGMEAEADKDGTKGSTHTDDAPFVTDGNLVTGRGAGCAEELAIELLRILAGNDVAKQVHDKSIQR